MPEVRWSRFDPDKKTNALAGKPCLVCTKSGDYDVGIFGDIGGSRGFQGNARWIPAWEVTHFAIIKLPTSNE